LGRIALALVAVLALLITMVAAPSIREDTGEPCRALEKLAVARALLTVNAPEEPYFIAMRQTIANTLTRERQPDGQTGRKAAARRRAAVPTYFGCAMGYWEVLLQPSSLDHWLAAMWDAT